MPPPPSYIDITATPFTRAVTVSEFNSGTFGGVANEVWFRYVTTANPVAFGWFIGLSTGFSPATNLYEDDGSTLINGNTGDNAMYWPLPNNSTFYVRIRRQGGGGIAVAFNTLFESANIGNLGTVPDGSWLVNDDGTITGTDEGFPSAVYGPDGDFIGFVSGIPAGEIGDSLPDRTSLWHDRLGMYVPGGFGLALFDSNFQFVDDVVPVPPLADAMPKISNDGTQFFVVDDGNIWTVSALGVISSVLDTIPFVNGVKAIGVSRDGTIVYWAEGYKSASIRQQVIGGADSTLYTIPGFVVDSDYVALTGVNNHPGEILVLIDGTIATHWFDTSANMNHLLHLSAAGAVLQDVQFDVATYGVLDHLHFSPNGAGSVYAWFFVDGTDNVGMFGEVTFATLAFVAIFTADLTSIGENKVGGSDQIFGPSASCSLVTVGYPSVEPPPPTPEGEIGILTELPIRWVLRTGVIT